MFRYTLLKLVQGTLSFIITFIVAKLFVGSIATSTIVTPTVPYITTFMYFIPFIIILGIYAIGKTFKKLLFHIS